VAFILEVFVMAAQMLSLNAGFSFAQTIDPSTQAESGVLLVFAQLVVGLLFFSLGLDREVIRSLAYSLDIHPAGAWLTRSSAEALLRLGGGMLTLAVRLALPGIALLVLADIALGLLGRINAQLQLLTLAFPLKMMGALVLLGWITVLLPKLLAAYAGAVFGTLRQLLYP
jgi:flagellar biosynthetic protein FliR